MTLQIIAVALLSLTTMSTAGIILYLALKERKLTDEILKGIENEIEQTRKYYADRLEWMTGKIMTLQNVINSTESKLNFRMNEFERKTRVTINSLKVSEKKKSIDSKK